MRGHVRIRPALPGMAETTHDRPTRAQRIRELLGVFETGGPAAYELHGKLHFYELLLETERLRLQGMFEELGCLPRANSPEPLRAAWDIHAQHFLAQTIEFVDRVRDRGLLVTGAVVSHCGFVALTANASLVSVGCTGLDGRRRVALKPIREHAGVFAHASERRLRAPARIGASLDFDGLRSSAVVALAYDRVPREDPAGLTRPHCPTGTVVCRLESPVTPIDEDRLRYQLAREEFGARRSVLDAELTARLLGCAMALQRSRETAGETPATLGELVGFTVEAGARYLCPAPGTVVRRGHDGSQEVFEDVDVGPQRVVRGAPLVLLTRAGGRPICCTGPIEAVYRRSLAEAC